MATHPTGLGKGLDALIRGTQETRDEAGISTLPLVDIVPNPKQPRRNFSEKSLEELAASIRSQGLLQPLLVRPLGPASPDKYEIVAGERRWRACQLAGLTEAPVLIRSFSAKDTLAAALVENLQREDLNPIDEALGLQTLKDEFGLSQDDLAQSLGKSRSAIANSLRLLALPESMRPLIAEGRLSAGHGRVLLSITEERAQEYLKNLILENRISVREAEGLAACWKETGRFELDMLHLGAEKPTVDADADDGDAPDVPIRAKAPRRPQSARLLEIQHRMTTLFKAQVKVSGQEDKGKIAFTYNSKEELDELLERLTDGRQTEGDEGADG